MKWKKAEFAYHDASPGTIFQRKFKGIARSRQDIGWQRAFDSSYRNTQNMESMRMCDKFSTQRHALGKDLTLTFDGTLLCGSEFFYKEVKIISVIRINIVWKSLKWFNEIMDFCSFTVLLSYCKTRFWNICIALCINVLLQLNVVSKYLTFRKSQTLIPQLTYFPEPGALQY